MPRIIFKCPYLKGGAKSASHLNNYVRYMATREGAQHLAPALAQCPVTQPQKQLVERLLRDFPLSRGLFEYEDYVAAPTQGNASEFITRALETISPAGRAPSGEGATRCSLTQMTLWSCLRSLTQ